MQPNYTIHDTPDTHYKHKIMAQYIIINRPDGSIYSVRSSLETGSEDPLTSHEEIINELHNHIQFLNRKVAAIHELSNK